MTIQTLTMSFLQDMRNHVTPYKKYRSFNLDISPLFTTITPTNNNTIIINCSIPMFGNSNYTITITKNRNKIITSSLPFPEAISIVNYALSLSNW